MDWSGVWVKFSRVFLVFLEEHEDEDEEMKKNEKNLPLAYLNTYLTNKKDHFALALIITLN